MVYSTYRAACKLQLKDYEASVEDCDQVITLTLCMLGNFSCFCGFFQNQFLDFGMDFLHQIFEFG